MFKTEKKYLKKNSYKANFLRKIYKKKKKKRKDKKEKLSYNRIIL